MRLHHALKIISRELRQLHNPRSQSGVTRGRVRLADAELDFVLGGHWPAPTKAPLPQKTTPVTAEEDTAVALSLVQPTKKRHKRAPRTNELTYFLLRCAHSANDRYSRVCPSVTGASPIGARGHAGALPPRRHASKDDRIMARAPLTSGDCDAPAALSGGG